MMGPLSMVWARNWDGVMELAVKPYSCVSFLHPALDALGTLIATHAIVSQDVEEIQLRFAASGCHCVDDNPLKSHCAQYVLPVRLARGELRFTDLFQDLRHDNDEVARLASRTSVTRDQGEFETLFPDFYVGEVTLTLKGGEKISERSDIARGYPEAPLSTGRNSRRNSICWSEVSPRLNAETHCTGRRDLFFEADNVDGLAALLAEPAVTGVRRGGSRRLDGAKKRVLWKYEWAFQRELARRRSAPAENYLTPPRIAGGHRSGYQAISSSTFIGLANR